MEIKNGNNDTDLILKIPIQSNKLEKELENIYEPSSFEYNPNIIDPVPFNDNNMLYNLNNTKDGIIINDVDIIKSKNLEYDIESDILNKDIFVNCKEFKNGIPNFTRIHCFWCCHSFTNQPCVLPKSLNDKKFKVIGCFCSPECASAYNFKNFPHNCWEYNALLNLLYKITYKNNSINIKPSPNREVLSIFGGKLSIDEFRSSSNYMKNHVLVYPPLVSSLSTHEENFNNKYKMNDLKIKRSTPLKTKNTLDKFVVTN
tara:strand:- start:17 stop:790 length:774 start_codon:yes stop_codon:yes gene_type:complete